MRFSRVLHESSKFAYSEVQSDVHVHEIDEGANRSSVLESESFIEFFYFEIRLAAVCLGELG
jgi:hypothetical protein